ncbi:glycosyltransferase family 2 protein [Pleurocapsa sp. PCC 7319]|uniref:glycosyltransferase family 2 protein n=1 Tax=Pleurocapsa sp. PCC 7319 TaxID=118161 RepID=UPI000349EAEC|nr:glycosyltransferase family 2 protein [Pleurocapsa sp. PCC 7319]
MTKDASKESAYIIIPVYNRRQITLSCLERLQSTGDLSRYQVVVVDDGSTDGTKEAIESLYPEATVIVGDGDLWWTGAIALGMQYGYERDAKYFIWLNDDCLPEPNALPQLVAFMEQHPDTIASASFYTPGATEPARYSGFRGRKGQAARSGETVEVEGTSGWCVGIPVAVVDRIGLPEVEKFPHYAGDSMYTLKATRAGFKAHILGDAIATLVDPGTSRVDLFSYFNPQLTLINSWHELFWHKKSPFRLPTQFFYQIRRYGLPQGLTLFLGKAFFWLAQWVQLQITSRLNSKNLNLEKNV